MATDQLAAGLTAEERKLLLLELFEQCSHTEQLEVLTSFTICLKRDFISLLPLEIVENILWYLDFQFIIRICMLVSKSWSISIKSCDKFWKERATLCGISQQTLMEASPMFESSYALTVSFFKREEAIKKMFLSRQNFTTLSREQDVIVLVDPLANGFYLRHGKEPSPSLELFRISEDNYCSRQENVFSNGIFRILWCECSSTRVVFHANNATWGEFKFSPAQPSLSPVYTEWEDIIVSRIHNQFCSCSDCGLIMTAAKSLTDDVQLQCAFIELRNSPVKEVARYQILQKMPVELSKLKSLRVYKLHLCCYHEEGNISTQNSCKEHLLICQANCFIFQCKITKSVELSRCEYKWELMKVICEEDSGHYFYSSFTLSRDKQLLSLVLNHGRNSVLTTWCVETGANRSVAVPVSSDVTEVRVIAVGSIYTVLETDLVVDYNKEKYLLLVHTHTGQLVARCSLPSLVQFGCDEGWMSSLINGEKPTLYKVIILDKSRGLQESLHSTSKSE